MSDCDTYDLNLNFSALKHPSRIAILQNHARNKGLNYTLGLEKCYKFYSGSGSVICLIVFLIWHDGENTLCPLDVPKGLICIRKLVLWLGVEEKTDRGL